MAAKAAAMAACCALVLLFVRGVARSLNVRRSAASTRKAGDPQPASRPPFRPRASPSKASPPSGRAAPATLLDRIPRCRVRPLRACKRTLGESVALRAPTGRMVNGHRELHRHVVDPVDEGRGRRPVDSPVSLVVSPSRLWSGRKTRKAREPLAFAVSRLRFLPARSPRAGGRRELPREESILSAQNTPSGQAPTVRR
jgi:hypothetical protein